MEVVLDVLLEVLLVVIAGEDEGEAEEAIVEGAGVDGAVSVDWQKLCGMKARSKRVNSVGSSMLANWSTSVRGDNDKSCEEEIKGRQSEEIGPDGIHTMAGWNPMMI